MTSLLFMGNALCPVSRHGRMTLPVAFRATLARRTTAPSFLIGRHEADGCLVAFDGDHAAELQSDCRRRRFAEEMSAPHESYPRARRVFGFMADVPLSVSGRFALPDMLRRLTGISDLALVIGTGDGFELWSPDAAIDSADAGLRDLATFLLPSASRLGE